MTKEELILKARVYTLEMYLQKVFIALKDVVEIITPKEHSVLKVGLMDAKRQVKKTLREFRNDLEYQNKS